MHAQVVDPLPRLLTKHVISGIGYPLCTARCRALLMRWSVRLAAISPLKDGCGILASQARYVTKSEHTSVRVKFLLHQIGCV